MPTFIITLLSLYIIFVLIMIFEWFYVPFETYTRTEFYLHKGNLTLLGYSVKLVILLPGYLLMLILITLRKLFVKEK